MFIALHRMPGNERNDASMPIRMRSEALKGDRTRRKAGRTADFKKAAQAVETAAQWCRKAAIHNRFRHKDNGRDAWQVQRF